MGNPEEEKPQGNNKLGNPVTFVGAVIRWIAARTRSYLSFITAYSCPILDGRIGIVGVTITSTSFNKSLKWLMLSVLIYNALA